MIARTLISGIAAALMAVTPVLAQSQVDRVTAKRDWSVFQATEGGSKVCWIVTKPVQWKAYRGGNDATAKVSRGEIYLMVSVRPQDKVAQEISLIAGYPLKKDGKIVAKIGSDSFAMFSEGESAWLNGTGNDAKMVAAMKRGRIAEVTGVSARGTKTVDEFSLLGFTAAFTAATDLCK